MKHNVSSLHNCYGCGVCAASCPKQIISIKLNKNGFYEPIIAKQNECINCKICLDVCAFNHEECALKLQDVQIKSWAAWSNDAKIRKKCSSGGIGFEIGKQLIEQGYHAVGCRYNIKKQCAEHYIATNVKSYIPSIGSKYIQSHTEEAFKKIKRKGQKYLITGTPCQIDSFRRMIQKFKCEENFILMDFYCHCVPSMLAWKAYVKMLENKIGILTYASWRNKFEYGWHDSWIMGVNGNKFTPPINWDDDYDNLLKENNTDIKSRMSKGDLFYKLFLGDICLGPQCEKQCKYKYKNSSADIRIGDLWGTTYSSNEEGVSALVAFTEKGQELIKMLRNVTLIEHPFEIVSEGQMQANAQHKELSKIVMFLLRNDIALDSIIFKATMLCQRIINKIKTIV